VSTVLNLQANRRRSETAQPPGGASWGILERFLGEKRPLNAAASLLLSAGWLMSCNADKEVALCSSTSISRAPRCHMFLVHASPPDSQMQAGTLLEDDEEEKEQFEGVSKNNDCEHQKGDAAAAVDGVTPRRAVERRCRAGRRRTAYSS
jgi:hypothetical protein